MYEQMAALANVRLWTVTQGEGLPLPVVNASTIATGNLESFSERDHTVVLKPSR